MAFRFERADSRNSLAGGAIERSVAGATASTSAVGLGVTARGCGSWTNASDGGRKLTPVEQKCPIPDTCPQYLKKCRRGI